MIDQGWVAIQLAERDRLASRVAQLEQGIRTDAARIAKLVAKEYVATFCPDEGWGMWQDFFYTAFSRAVLAPTETSE